MKDNYQLTIRKVDPLLHKRIKARANLKNQSLNDWALDALRKEAGITDSSGTRTDKKEPSWKKYVGVFKQEQVFDDAFFDDIERVDPEMWK